MMARTSSGDVSSGKDRAFFNWRYIRGKYERRREHRLAFILLWSILLGFLFRTFVVTVGVVNDTSMHPALGEGGYYLVNKYIYHFVRPQRGDIVVFRVGQYDTEEQVKRIIGLPGETLQITSGEVYINGRRLDEPYAVGATYPDFGPTTVEEHSYFVFGDTRWVREDSRDFGAVPLKNIVGKVKPGEFFPFR
ncbi:MAG: signal peptidase I [Candidatus Methylomirabilales bacterium]